MLDWTYADWPYVQALSALDAVSRELLSRQLKDGEYLGSSLWQDLGAIGASLRAAWLADRRRRGAR